MPAVLNEKAVYTFIMKKRWIIVSLVAAAAAGFGGMKMYADYQEQEELKRRQAAYDKADSPNGQFLLLTPLQVYSDIVSHYEIA